MRGWGREEGMLLILKMQNLFHSAPESLVRPRLPFEGMSLSGIPLAKSPSGNSATSIPLRTYKAPLFQQSVLP